MHCFRFVVCLMVCWLAGACQAETFKVLFVGKQPDHPYGTHMYEHTCRMLAKCLEKTDNFESVVSIGWPSESSTLKGVDTIVVYSSPGAEFLLDSPGRDQFSSMMNDGVGLVTIHWASSVNQSNLERLGPKWTSFLGGTWVSNVGLHTGKSPLKQLQPEHPICRGWSEYELHDEYYLNPTIKEATPLLQVTAGDQSVVVGWAFERKDGGRAFGTTLGHFYRNFQREPFRKMIVNAIVWSAGANVPDAGTKVDLGESDLALPSQ